MTQNKQQAVILSPVGRLVQGHPFEFRDTNFEGAPLVTREGEPRVQYFLAVAIRKDDPDVNAFWQQIQQMGQAAWPTGETQRQDFAWKLEDGDHADNKDKEGFAGCWVFKFQGGFAPKVYDINPALMIVDPKKIKRGDYIRVYSNVRANGSKGNPGIFLNPTLVQLCGYGDEIVTGPDGTAVFGGAPAVRLPPGASNTPVAPKAGPALPGGGPAPASHAAAPSLPGGPAPAAATPPGPGPSAPAPAAPAAPAMPPVQVRKMLPKAGAYSYEQYVAQGWKDADLIAQGYMTVEAQSPGTGVTPAPNFLNR
jgi:hypothetical protein